LSAYQSLFQRLDLNWQSVFARYVGPDLGGLCSSLLKACSQFTRRQTQITAKNLTEVLQEEKRLLVPREELEDFFKDIKTLQMDVDRMEARYKTLA
ncbi:MAG: sterol-binding protein, partial [Gammaproteobacteria bacterium]|nr:sterol-binding protein [Gammaproteobacteria bacterium]